MADKSKLVGTFRNRSFAQPKYVLKCLLQSAFIIQNGQKTNPAFVLATALCGGSSYDRV